MGSLWDLLVKMAKWSPKSNLGKKVYGVFLTVGFICFALVFSFYSHPN